MEFYSNTRRPPRIREKFTNTEQIVYKETIDTKTGERKLVETEKVDIYDKIQEYGEEVKISNILKKYDVDLSKQVKNSEEKLIDLTNVPENLIETMAIIDNAKDIWEKQSKEIKQKFNNDFKQFIAGSENGQIVNMVNEQLKTEHKQKAMPTYNDILATMQRQNEMIANLTANREPAVKTETKTEEVTE